MKKILLLKLPGISLIELIVYAALVSVIIGAFFVITSNYLSSSARDREQAEAFMNQQFVSQKITNLMNGATGATLIPTSGSSSVLGVRQTPTTYNVIYLVSGSAASAIGNDPNSDGQIDSYSNSVALTNNHVTVSSLTFTRQTINDQPAILVQATLQGKYKTITINKTEYIK